jgi:hypothetical protein
MVYTCKFCSRDYKEKFNHDRHTQTCEFLSKTRREQDNEIDSFEKLPTQKEMFLLVQQLSIRITKLEKENSQLKGSIKRKMNFNDILNQNIKPEFQYKIWCDILIDNVEKFLDKVYNSNLLNATNDLFTYFIDNYNDRLPIRAYDIKPNIFYIYDEDETWTSISTSEFDKLLARISHKFLVEFNRCWCVVNREKIETMDIYKELYMDYYRKILGGDRISDETRYTRIRQHIYAKIKRNIRSSCIEESS